MRILVTNDDGIHAPGLVVLEEIARQFSDDVWVCAPSDNQTGAGHSLTLSMPVRLRKHSARRWSVTGTPTDAISIGLKQVLDSPPDLILSGVNAGANLGDDLTYSGTVSAAMEGALAGIKSIAMSQVMKQERPAWDDRFAAARHWGPEQFSRCLMRRSNCALWSASTFPAARRKMSRECAWFAKAFMTMIAAV